MHANEAKGSLHSSIDPFALFVQMYVYIYLTRIIISIYRYLSFSEDIWQVSLEVKFTVQFLNVIRRKCTCTLMYLFVMPLLAYKGTFNNNYSTPQVNCWGPSGHRI